MGLDLKTLAAAKSYTKQSFEGVGALKGKDGLSPTIMENAKNSNSIYKLDIEDINGTFTTPNLKGEKGYPGKDGKDGRSIRLITKDDNNNIIVTFTDNTTQNIGQLNVDVQANFLTSNGFGNLRYYDGHFQYYNTDLSKWVDTTVTSENVIVVNMTPNPMRHIMGIYDYEIGHYKLKWEEPEDTVIDGHVVCLVEKVVLRRKLGSVPKNENDGVLVAEIERSDFGSNVNSWYVDTSLSPNEDDVYYYKAFPMSTTGFYNTSTQNETGGIKAKDHWLYGFALNQSESDPTSMIEYIEDNKKFRSAFMNYTTNTFNYGDWEDAYFINKLKPCVLGFDGTVLYEIDKNDYSKKIDGTDSEITNNNIEGNVMVGFPKVYWKITAIDDEHCEVRFSSKKVDNDYHCWSHIDNKGNEIDYCYMPAYNGSLVSDKLRSLSDKTPLVNRTSSAEINYANSNNPTSDVIWYTEVFSDRMLVNLLLLLIGKSTNTQAVFGAGNNNAYVSTSNTGVKVTGTMNTNGLFWGNQDNKSGVKIFGMEHWWGNIYRRIAGWINDKGVQKVKLTYGQTDGSTIDGYNFDGNGYISITNSTPIGTNGGYISKMKFSDYGLIPTISNGSATTYFTDGLWFHNGQIDYALAGGGAGSRLLIGALFTILGNMSSYASWDVGAAVSCKPLAQIGGAS